MIIYFIKCITISWCRWHLCARAWRWNSNEDVVIGHAMSFCEHCASFVNFVLLKLIVSLISRRLDHSPSCSIRPAIDEHLLLASTRISININAAWAWQFESPHLSEQVSDVVTCFIILVIRRRVEIIMQIVMWNIFRRQSYFHAIGRARHCGHAHIIEYFIKCSPVKVGNSYNASIRDEF